MEQLISWLLISLRQHRVTSPHFLWLSCSPPQTYNKTHTHWNSPTHKARVQHFKQTAIEHQWGHRFTARQRASTTCRPSTNPVWWRGRKDTSQICRERVKGKVCVCGYTELERKKQIVTARIATNICFWTPLDCFMWILSSLHDVCQLNVERPLHNHTPLHINWNFLKLKAALHPPVCVWGSQFSTDKQ